MHRELDATVMRAIASLLSGLPLQPEGMETEIVEAKSQLFLKWATKYIIYNLLKQIVGKKLFF